MHIPILIKTLWIPVIAEEGIQPIELGVEWVVVAGAEVLVAS